MFVQKMMCAMTYACALGATVMAAGNGINSNGVNSNGAGLPTTTPSTEFTLRIPNEMAPAGALVQMKVMTTEVTPISGGRPGFSFSHVMFADAVGFGMFATGDLAGAAVLEGDHVDVSYMSNAALTADYPMLTVALRIRPDAATGSKTLFTFDQGAIWNVVDSTPIVANRISPSTVEVGGTVAITDVVPGEGVWPAGTVISIRGVGFDSRTQLRVNDLATSNITIVSPTELQFTLTKAAEMRGVKLIVQGQQNADTYYSYMRAVPAAPSARTLLAATVPIFALAPRSVATFGVKELLGARQYQAVALQNPTADEVAVDVALVAADGTPIIHTSRTLASRHRVSLEASELLDGVAAPAGSTLVVTASSPIDAMGLLCDEGSWSVEPFLPLESPQ
jgi:IPT/TIG domain